MPAFSSALIAHLEATREDIGQKNIFSIPIPYPNWANDWISVMRGHLTNEALCRSDPHLRAWLRRCRLNPGASLAAHSDPADESWNRQWRRVRDNGQAAAQKLQEFDALPAASATPSS